jgi:hypothetical protein
MTDHKQSCTLIATTPNDIDNTWCVYRHLMVFTPGEPPTLVFINTCKVIDVFLMREARNNSDWCNLAALGCPIVIEIVHTFDDQSAAMRYAHDMVKSQPEMPRCNLHGYNMFGSNRIILCNDGREFTSQAEAARMLGCSQSAISQHMKGRLGSIKGLKLAYKTRTAR